MKQKLDYNEQYVVWGNLKELTKQVSVGQLISRAFILLQLKVKLGWVSETTIDNYRNYLTKAGYFKIHSRGIYEKVKDVPDDLTLHQVLFEAYGKKAQKTPRL